MKQIRKLFFILLASTMAYSCGEAGVGFDVTADFPVTAPIEIPIPANPFHPTIENVDPDATILDYSLEDVGAFSNALDELGNAGIDEDAIEINGMAFEILGVDSDEMLAIDELTLNITVGSTVISIPIAENMLANKSKTDIALTSSESSSLLAQLRNSGNISSEIVVDLGNIDTSDQDRVIGFDFKLYFDVLLKARNL